MTRIMVYFTLFSTLILASVAKTQIYKWTDDKGKVHFTDALPIDQKGELLDEKELNKRISVYTHKTVKVKPIAFGVNKQANMLEMYTTSSCTYCAKARAYFAKKDIDYTEKNITLSKKYHKEFKAIGGKGVPLIIAGKYQMSGFNETSFQNMYSKSRKSY